MWLKYLLLFDMMDFCALRSVFNKHGCTCTLSCSGSFSTGVGGTPIQYLCGYVPPNGVVILKLLIQKGISISEAFSRTAYKNCGSRLCLLLKMVADYEEALNLMIV